MNCLLFRRYDWVGEPWGSDSLRRLKLDSFANFSWSLSVCKDSLQARGVFRAAHWSLEFYITQSNTFKRFCNSKLDPFDFFTP